MDLYGCVLLIPLVLFGDLSLATDIPGNSVQSTSESSAKFMFSDLFSSRQRTRRYADSDVTEDYEDDVDYDIPRWVRWVVPWKTSQRNCRCTSRRDSSGRKTSYDYDGQSQGSRYCTSLCRNSYNRGNSRRRGNRWFDNRDDYADEILVYRFYNGGQKNSYRDSENTRNRQGYQGRRRTGTRGSEYSEAATGYDELSE